MGDAYSGAADDRVCGGTRLSPPPAAAWCENSSGASVGFGTATITWRRAAGAGGNGSGWNESLRSPSWWLAEV